MTQLIEDYALIGNNLTAALVARNGSIDWLGFPRFDSPACFAALLGTAENGQWSISPKVDGTKAKRRYRQGTLVLETEYETSDGTVVLIDCMHRRGIYQDVVRVVKGLSGSVEMQLELSLRFDYGSVVPWVSRLADGRLQAVAGPDRIVLSSPVPLRGEEMKTRAVFTVKAGEEISFVMTWSRSHAESSGPVDGIKVVEEETKSWGDWSSGYTEQSPYREAVLRSLITLKALTHVETGGIVAAPTTSLPEDLGGVRNWDYRACWLRDSTFTLNALLLAGFMDEAKNWNAWLLRAVAGDPGLLQIMYGVGGERRLTEFEMTHLPGYQNSLPVRIGNAASTQLQLDVYGEVLSTMYESARKGLHESEATWSVGRAIVEHLETIWTLPDDGIWEIRGPRREFVHSKVMAWVAFDRAVRLMEEFQYEGPLERWKKVRNEIHGEVCRFGFSKEVNAFVQYYGSKDLDASLLLLPMVGFLPPEDPRIQSTLGAIERRLMQDGYVARYSTTSSVDGLPGGEGKFLACSFWLVSNYVLQKRMEDARNLFERLLAIRNDVGLLSEEYDPKEERMLGNFPQALSHLALVDAAHRLTHPENNTFAPPSSPGSDASCS
jgi:GH15 family glucan-1,4-alpha-glucosidase